MPETIDRSPALKVLDLGKNRSFSFSPLQHLNTNMRACECMYTNKWTCMHAYMHIHMHTCIHAYMHTCIHAYMHTCIHAYMHTCVHAYMQDETYMHTCIQSYTRTCKMKSTCIQAKTGLCHSKFQVVLENQISRFSDPAGTSESITLWHKRFHCAIFKKAFGTKINCLFNSSLSGPWSTWHPQ